MKIISWNVNGINSCAEKGLIDFILKEKADIYCFQEVKVAESNLNQKLLDIDGYKNFWSFSKQNGRSGLVIYSKKQPIKIINGIGEEIIDDEARIQTMEFKEFFLINCYFPHANRELTRLKFKLEFNKKFERFCNELKNKKPIIIMGDLNVAHKEIDLKNPKQNQKNAGFTIEERNWFDGFLKEGYIDTFREFTSEGGWYTWWSYRNKARERNIGWRIDYFIVNSILKNKVKKSYIMTNIKGSDHCPICLEINI